jgi:hypothetical protein
LDVGELTRVADGCREEDESIGSAGRLAVLAGLVLANKGLGSVVAMVGIGDGVGGSEPVKLIY